MGQSEHSDDQTRPRSQPRRRRRPPWGDLLGGKPIERQIWSLGRKIARKEDDLTQAQFQKMVVLKDHYGIHGGDRPAPVGGVAPVDWVPWYQLSLRLASELDPSLTIVDTPPLSKTAPRWRGADGQLLLTLVETFKEMRPNRSIRWCLKEIQKYNANLQQYSLDELNTRYHEAQRHFGGAHHKAKRHFGSTEHRHKKKHPS
jgi:hypothetical protein